MRCVILQLVGKRHTLKVFRTLKQNRGGETERDRETERERDRDRDTERETERESKTITFRESLFGNIMAFPFLA